MTQAPSWLPTIIVKSCPKRTKCRLVCPGKAWHKKMEKLIKRLREK